MTPAQLSEYVRSQRSQAVEARPQPYYSRVGDFVSYCWNPKGPFFARRVDEFNTCYISMTTKAVVGWKIKGIGFILDQFAKAAGGQTQRATLARIADLGRRLSKNAASQDRYTVVQEHGDVDVAPWLQLV